MKIKSIIPVGTRPVYDITINNDDYDKQSYVLENGVISHNTGIYYSADNIWIIGRQQDKKGTDIVGYRFIINIEKSRYLKEKSKIPITVSWDGGIQAYSGLLEVALAGEYVVAAKKGWYSRVDRETGEVIGSGVRSSETFKKEFWDPIFETTDFADFIKQQYSFDGKSLVDFDDIAETEVIDLGDTSGAGSGVWKKSDN